MINRNINQRQLEYCKKAPPTATRQSTHAYAHARRTLNELPVLEALRQSVISANAEVARLAMETGNLKMASKTGIIGLARRRQENVPTDLALQSI